MTNEQGLEAAIGLSLTAVRDELGQNEPASGASQDQLVTAESFLVQAENELVAGRGEVAFVLLRGVANAAATVWRDAGAGAGAVVRQAVASL